MAGQTVKVALQMPEGPQSLEYWIEDYWDRVAGQSWMRSDGNPACLKYAMRAGVTGLPTDDEVLYGKFDDPRGFRRGELVHVSELVAEA
jgi:hypothetical protein